LACLSRCRRSFPASSCRWTCRSAAAPCGRPARQQHHGRQQRSLRLMCTSSDDLPVFRRGGLDAGAKPVLCSGALFPQTPASGPH
jgi:hypothetical protein